MAAPAPGPAAGPPAWWRLTMAAPGELEESLLWKLEHLGIHRLAIRHGPETPHERELLAWLPEADWPEAQRQELVRALEPLGEPFGLALPPVQWERQPEEDWSLSWKRHWQPDPVGARLLILPAWLELPQEHAERLVIRMDPGSAFGTGSHPTTRLCLEALETALLQRRPASGGGRQGPPRVADLGCGSGILGLGALRLGASAVAAVDTDPLAVRATVDNALLNGFRAAVGEDPAPEPAPLQVAQGSIEVLAALQQRLWGAPADLLLCNILAPVIEALSPQFGAVLAPEGVGLLSGLLVDQAPALERSLAAAGWRAELTASLDRWGLMTIRRPAVVS